MKFLTTSLTLCSVCLMFVMPAAADESGQNYARQLELMNELTKREMQLEYLKLESELQIRFNELDKQNVIILAQLKVRDSDMGNYIDAISWVSGIVIGFVGILFGIGAFILYRENQDVSTKMRLQLDAWNEQTANIQTTFDGWFDDAKTEYAREIDFLSRLMRLRSLLDQPNPTADEIYPEVSPLFANPQLQYLPIFRKIASLDLGADIKRHTEAAINQLMANQKSQS